MVVGPSVGGGSNFERPKSGGIDGEMVGGLHSSNTSSMYPAPLTASHQRSKLRLTRSI